jgi:hypothetical protein
MAMVDASTPAMSATTVRPRAHGMTHTMPCSQHAISVATKGAS